ncbi:MAG: OmpA family protein [Myxococcales bacterium]|nr:OmpA family protein [Myxococcales bacterium]
MRAAIRTAALAATLCPCLALAQGGDSNGSQHARLHLSAAGFGSLLARYAGAEVGASWAPASFVEVGATANLGRYVGGRLTVGLHPSEPFAAGLRPLLQLRGVLHPVEGGAGIGGGALVGGSLEAGPGRLIGGVLGEFFSGPAAYTPFALHALAGYELDLLKPTRVVEVRPADADKDGVMDLDDACPSEPGPATQRGCPLRDRDGDGVADDADKCVAEPEDKDEFQDDDGCPDADNDRDGIADLEDRCPNAAEDADGFQDEDGCPDLDDDGDGIADARDKCPAQPETYNGTDDEDGCPELAAKVFVEKEKKKIVITERVHFEYAKDRLLPRSHPILRGVADLMKRFHGIKKVRVEGHTDDRGTGETNQRLSERRAARVTEFLIKSGIDPLRLESVGFGKSRPLAQERGEGAREMNRRVEFVIVDPAEFTPE